MNFSSVNREARKQQNIFKVLEKQTEKLPRSQNSKSSENILQEKRQSEEVFNKRERVKKKEKERKHLKWR